jgi:hypothetical protein
MPVARLVLLMRVLTTGALAAVMLAAMLAVILVPTTGALVVAMLELAMAMAMIVRVACEYLLCGWLVGTWYHIAVASSL